MTNFRLTGELPFTYDGKKEAFEKGIPEHPKVNGEGLFPVNEVTNSHLILEITIGGKPS